MKLQWDRAFDGAEIGSAEWLDARLGLLLQWDRAFDGAEIILRLKRNAPELYASMGPRL